MLEVVFVLTYVDADVRDFHVFGSASWKLYGTVSPVYGIRSPVYFQQVIPKHSSTVAQAHLSVTYLG